MAAIEDALQAYNQSNFDVAATAAKMRELGGPLGLSEAQLAAAVPVFGDYHRSRLNSGYTEGSSYGYIAAQAVKDALKARGQDGDAWFNGAPVSNYLASEDAQARQRWQATQEDDGGLFGLGSFGTVLGIAGLALGGAGALGLLGEGLGAGALGAIDAGIGVGAGFGAADIAGGLIPEFGSLGAGAATAAGTGTGAMDWFEQLMQNYNPDLGFQGLNEAGSGMTGGMGATGIDWSSIDKMINNLGSNAWEAENLGTAGSVAGQSSVLNLLKNLPTNALKSLGLTNPDGSINGTSLASLLGKLGAAGLGAYGANQQSNALADLAKKYSDYGAPSRARFEAGMSPGFDPMSIPGYAGALDTASKSLLARLSATGGNPFGQPGGLIEANKAIVSGTALPALNEYLRQNANVGFGSSMNAAIPLETGAVGQQGNIYNALGYGLNTLTNPQPSLSDMVKALQQGGLA